jgi:hypothetical protein
VLQSCGGVCVSGGEATFKATTIHTAKGAEAGVSCFAYAHVVMEGSAVVGGPAKHALRIRDSDVSATRSTFHDTTEEVGQA